MATSNITYLLKALDQLDEFGLDLQVQIAIGRRMPHKEVATLDDNLVCELSSALELVEKRERFTLGELRVSRNISPATLRDLGWEHTCVSRFATSRFRRTHQVAN